MITRKSQVEVIDISDQVKYAWMLSKFGQKDEYSSELDILKMQLPVVGFKNYIIELSSSLLFRDLIFTLRPIIPWAISTRSYKYTYDNLVVSEEEFNFLTEDQKLHLKANLEAIVNRVNDGEAIDSVKQDLPMIMSTKYCININHRTLINFIYTLECELPQYFNIFGNKFLDAINLSYNDYKDSKKVNLINYLKLKDNELTLSGHSQIGDIHYLFCDVQNNLLAQFIRQHNSLIKNGLYNKCINDFNKSILMTCRDITKVGSYLTTDSLNNLVKVRSCWFAQFDKSDKSSWASIIGEYVKHMSLDEFKYILPCHGCAGDCIIKEDMINKIHKEDVATPCPLFIEDGSVIEKRESYYKSNSEIFNKWKELCKSIYTNLDNPYLKIYEGL